MNENENLFVPAFMGYDQEMVSKSKDWVERLNPESKLLNFNIGRILVPENQAVNESLKPTKTSNTPETSKDSEAKILTLPLLKNLQGASPSSEVMPLTFQPHSPKEGPGLVHTEVKDTEQESEINELTKLVQILIDEKVNSTQKTQESNLHIQQTESSNENYKAQPYQYESPSNQILKAKAKPFPPCTHCGFNDHKPDDCRNYPKCEICGSYDHFTSGNNRVIHVKGGVLAESSQSSESSIGVKCNTCESIIHSTTNHNEFENFKQVSLMSINHEKYTLVIVDEYSRMVENQNDVKVKQIKTDNETEYINHELESVCDEKGISHNFSSPYTPEQNGVAKMKNRTLIEAARTILNGSDRLGKFDAKADDEYFLGYSFISKAFRFFNRRRQQVEETYHVTFDESMEAIRFTNTLVDEIRIDDSTRYPLDEDDPSRQYQVDSNVSYYVISHGRSLTELTQENHVPEVIAPNEPDIPLTEDNEGPPDLINTEGTHEQNIQNEQIITQPTEGLICRKMYRTTVPPLNLVLIISRHPPPENLVPIISRRHVAICHWTAVTGVSDSGTGRIATWHHVASTCQPCVSGVNSKTQPRLGSNSRPPAIGSKWVFMIKKDEHGITTKDKARLVAQGYSQEEGIGYNKTFSPVARVEAIRIFLAFAIYMNFKVYQIDVKSAFLNGKIKEEVYVKQPPGFESSEFPDYVYKLDKALYGLKQAPRACLVCKISVQSKGITSNCYEKNPRKKTPWVPAKYVENWFDRVLRNSGQWLCRQLRLNMLLLSVVQSTVVAYEPFSSTDETEQCPFREFLIKFLLLNGKRPLNLDFNTFCSSTGLDYNNDKYVAYPTPEVVKKELGKISINPSYLDKTLILKNSFLMAWRILFTFVIQVLGRNYSSTEQVNLIQQLLAYYLITGTEVDIGVIIYSDLVTKLLNNSRLKYVSYPRLSHVLYKCYQVVTTLRMDKDLEGNKSPTDMEPINPTVADPLETGAEYQSDEEEVFAAGDDMEEDTQADEEEHQSPSPNKDQPEPSHSSATQVSDFASSIPNLKKFDNIIPLTERKLIKYLRNASVAGYYEENIAHQDQTDKLVEASMSSLDRICIAISDLYVGLDIITELLKDIKNVVKDDHVLNKKVIEATEAYTKNSSALTELLNLVKNFDFQGLKSVVESLKATALRQDEHFASWAKLLNFLA
uniref:Integrase catalytic domain-containing protein n=1 Tax=Tanacetum cinerariifolium TaxID=118510 RepID=A0A699H8J4_TANCI|nr:hypothetical protein [Tanacetum cinerariifolium]